MINTIKIWWYELMLSCTCDDVEYLERAAKLVDPFKYGSVVAEIKLEKIHKLRKKADEQLANIATKLEKLKRG